MDLNPIMPFNWHNKKMTNILKKSEKFIIYQLLKKTDDNTALVFYNRCVLAKLYKLAGVNNIPELENKIFTHFEIHPIENGYRVKAQNFEVEVNICILSFLKK